MMPPDREPGASTGDGDHAGPGELPHPQADAGLTEAVARSADDDASGRPFVVPCATLSAGASLRWVAAGWRDVRRAPGLSLLFGAVIVLVSIGISALAWSLGRFALLATLLSGFVFVAPLLCVGLYCVSRGLERGRTPRLRDSFVLARRVIGQAGVFAIVQGVIVLLWSRAGMMVGAFFPNWPAGEPEVHSLVGVPGDHADGFAAESVTMPAINFFSTAGGANSGMVLS